MSVSEPGHAASPGYTMLELMMAIVVTAMVVSLVFASYINVYRMFSRQHAGSADLQAALVVRTRISQLFAHDPLLVHCDGRSLQWREGPFDSLKVLRQVGTALLLNRDTLARDVERLHCIPGNAPGREGRVLVEWEIALSGGRWIGGAAPFRPDASVRR